MGKISKKQLIRLVDENDRVSSLILSRLSGWSVRTIRSMRSSKPRYLARGIPRVCSDAHHANLCYRYYLSKKNKFRTTNFNNLIEFVDKWDLILFNRIKCKEVPYTKEFKLHIFGDLKL